MEPFNSFFIPRGEEMIQFLNDNPSLPSRDIFEKLEANTNTTTTTTTTTLDSNISNSQKTEITSTTQDSEGMSSFEKITNIFASIFSMNINSAKALTNQIFEIQKNLTDNELSIIPISENTPIEIIVTKRLAFCLLNVIGKGSHSNVYEVKTIASSRLEFNGTTLSPSKPHAFAVKKSKHVNVSYSPEKRDVDNATGSRKEGIDFALETFKELGGYAISIHHKYENSVSHTSFSEMPNPVFAVLNVFICIADALNNFHKKGFIHRDIKGANLLVQTIGNHQIGVITDFGSLAKEEEKTHFTQGTPEYLDPQMFGDAETTLVNQRLRKGLQTKEGDIFSLGLTIIYDVLIPYIEDLASSRKHENEITRILNKLKPMKNERLFSTNELKMRGWLAPLRCMYRHIENNEGRLIQYPNLTDSLNWLSECFRLLEDTISEEEIKTFIDLGQLACNMQDPNLNERPDAETVKNELIKLESNLKSIRTKKRKLEEENTTEIPVRNKRPRVLFKETESTEATIVMEEYKI